MGLLRPLDDLGDGRQGRHPANMGDLGPNHSFRPSGQLLEVYVWLVGQIGRPIDQPWAAVQLIPAAGAEFEPLAKEARAVIDQELARLSEFCVELTEGRYPVC